MRAKLTILCIALLLSFSATAEDEPIRFTNLQVASAWFAKHYPGHEMKKHVVGVGGGDMEIYAFYGPRGSGFVRVDGWFYECVKKSTCGLVAMANLGLSRNLKSYPAVTFEDPYLVIKSSDSNLIKLKLKDD
jgi:hypothetical protein